MNNQDKIYKIHKYTYRMKKSFMNNDMNNYNKYSSHLKYHIGGNNSNQEIDFGPISELINIINSNKNKYNFEKIKNDIKTLQEDKKTLQEDKKTLQDSTLKLTEEIVQSKTKIQNYEKIIKKIKDELNVDVPDKDLEAKLIEALEKLENKTSEQEKNIAELQNELLSNITEKTKALEIFTHDKSTEFSVKMLNLFKSIYGDEEAKIIMEEVNKEFKKNLEVVESESESELESKSESESETELKKKQEADVEVQVEKELKKKQERGDEKYNVSYKDRTKSLELTLNQIVEKLTKKTTNKNLSISPDYTTYKKQIQKYIDTGDNKDKIENIIKNNILLTGDGNIFGGNNI